MARFRICRSFVVESGHMLSKHPEACRYPHGHTRRIEVVVSGEGLDANDMVCDFKALKMALEHQIEALDHAMALNSGDPLLASMQGVYPQSLVIFENEDPTTEVLARWLFQTVDRILKEGFSEGHYTIPAGSVTLERVRVWETPNSWAEYGL